tara:strand:- start:24526 stop:24981 length:456 start_codon:yes stop_codon:yes gene_type:complete
METVALSGNDTQIINQRVLNDLADGDAVMIEFPNEIATLEKGKNGNTIYALNETGNVCNMTIRVIRGSSDDKYLNNLLLQMKANFAGFVTMSGRFVKKVGDGQGNITNDTYIMSGGIFTNQVAAKSNQAGDTEQSVSIYTLRFSNAPRSLR